MHFGYLPVEQLLFNGTFLRPQILINIDCIHNPRLNCRRQFWTRLACVKFYWKVATGSFKGFYFRVHVKQNICLIPFWSIFFYIYYHSHWLLKRYYLYSFDMIFLFGNGRMCFYFWCLMQLIVDVGITFKDYQ